MEGEFHMADFGGWLAVSLALLVIYYIFLGRAVLQMLRGEANPVLLTFACIALLPLPPAIVMGVVLMIIWAIRRGDQPA